MIILASVIIISLSSSGIINKANDAINSTQIAMEKSVIEQAGATAKGTNKTEKPTVSQMQKAINEVANEGVATVIDDGETIVVKFNESNRYYEINNSGYIEGPKELIKDDYAGDITKGGTYVGSSDKPFKISCIEDLVAFSIMTNGGNSDLGLVSTKFDEQYVELTKTLDFVSMFSYSDYTTTVYGDINRDGEVEDIRTELTKTDEGCIGFNRIGAFQGEFNGNGEEIRNIYMNTISRASGASLFVEIQSGTLKNLGLTGEIYAGTYAAGFSEYVSGMSRIINCYNKANIVAQCGSTASKRYGRD